MKTVYWVMMLVMLFGANIGCRKEGPAEKAGRKLEEAVDNVSEGKSPLHEKGPLEKAGEDIDEAVEDLKKN